MSPSQNIAIGLLVGISITATAGGTYIDKLHADNLAMQDKWLDQRWDNRMDSLQLAKSREFTYDDVYGKLNAAGWSDASVRKAALICSMAVFGEIDQ